jgi:hypothetical protein
MNTRLTRWRALLPGMKSGSALLFDELQSGHGELAPFPGGRCLRFRTFCFLAAAHRHYLERRRSRHAKF